MFGKETEQRIFILMDGTVDEALEGFITDRKSRGLSPRTIDFYIEKLSRFRKYIQEKGILQVVEISTADIRLYLLGLSETCNNGGVHAHYRALRSLFYWWESESVDFNNPIKKVSAPKVINNPKEGIAINDVMKMVGACKTGMGERDSAILLALVDTGCRASEFLAIDVGNLNLIEGDIQILQGKGGKFRTVYLGRNSRRKVRKYLKTRREVFPHSPLWVTNDGYRLTYSGLRQIIRRRAGDANVKTPGIHDFRRCFAIEFLRNDGDIFTLQKILGHSSLEMVKRYLALVKADCETAHRKASPVDRWNP